jgi:hypothetical protein
MFVGLVAYGVRKVVSRPEQTSAQDLGARTSSPRGPQMPGKLRAFIDFIREAN